MRHRLHSLGLAHTITSKKPIVQEDYEGDFLKCAFTQKKYKGDAMFHRLHNEVISYGNAADESLCTEHVPVVQIADLKKSYGDKDYTEHFYDHDRADHAYQTFTKNAVPALKERLQDGDFILAWFGTGHYDVIQALNLSESPEVFVVEPGIGYPYTFAPYKVYESYAKMHIDIGAWSQAYDIYKDLYDKVPGLSNIFPWTCRHYTNPNWHDTVIPNYFDPKDFDFRADNDGYYMFIGRQTPTKGLELAMRLADYMGKKLIVAGQGDFEKNMGFAPWDCVEFIGTVNLAERRKWLAGAELVICASYYPEPFCGTHIEALLSGTPILTTDWGVFPETVPHGIVGFRCRTFNQFVAAARHIHEIQPYICRTWAENNFSLDRVSLMYQEYFDNIVRIAEHDDNFWAIADAGASLDALRRPFSPEATLASLDFIRQKNKAYADNEQRVADAVETQLQLLLDESEDTDAMKSQIMKTVMREFAVASDQ